MRLFSDCVVQLSLFVSFPYYFYSEVLLIHKYRTGLRPDSDRSATHFWKWPTKATSQ